VKLKVAEIDTAILNEIVKNIIVTGEPTAATAFFPRQARKKKQCATGLNKNSTSNQTQPSGRHINNMFKTLSLA